MRKRGPSPERSASSTRTARSVDSDHVPNRGLVSTAMEDSVTVGIDASASIVWQLFSDVTRIGEFSPETFEAERVGGAHTPAVGARFRGHVKRNQKGPTYWSTCEVTE